MAKQRGLPIEESDKRKLNKKNFEKLFGIFKFAMPYKVPFIIGMVFCFFQPNVVDFSLCGRQVN